MDFQTFQSIIEIIGRILFGSIAIGIVLGACLHKKYKVFNDILVGTLWLALVYGFIRCLSFAIFGV